jgi:ribosome-associated protein
MVNGVIDEVKDELDIKPWRVEGEADSGWVLMDYGDVVVHLFAPEAREYYDLEGFWKDGRVIVRML